MPISWNHKKFELARLLLERIDSRTGVTAEGGLVMRSFDFDLDVSLLAGLTGFSDEVNERRRVRLTHEAIRRAKGAGDLTAEGFLRTVDNLQADYLRQQTRPYVLLSSLSLQFDPRLRVRRQPDATFTFSPKPPRRFQLPESLERRPSLGDPRPEGYTYVRTAVQARDAESAAEVAVHRLNIMRAVWVLFYHSRRSRITLGGHPSAISSISFGSLHTIHTPHGALASSLIWTERARAPATRLRILTHWDQLRRFERWVQRQLSRLPFRGKMESILVRYVEALDSDDLDASFLKLWALLEHLTASQGARYDVTIKRASYVYRDPSYHQIVLDHLRSWRNRIVHEGTAADDSEILVNSLKEYVETLIYVVLDEPGDFRTLDELGQFLSSPEDVTELHKRRRFVRLALDLARRRAAKDE